MAATVVFQFWQSVIVMSRSPERRLGLIQHRRFLLLRKRGHLSAGSRDTCAVCDRAPISAPTPSSSATDLVILQNVFAELTLNDVESSVASLALNASAFIVDPYFLDFDSVSG
jgi:hypothetical protein